VESSDDISSSTALPRTCQDTGLFTALSVVDAAGCSIILATGSSIAVSDMGGSGCTVLLNVQYGAFTGLGYTDGDFCTRGFLLF